MKPRPGLLEFLFRRILSIVWAILQIERAELLHLEKSASANRSKAHADTQLTDEELVALDPLIPEARARILARLKEKGLKPTPGSDVSPIGPDDIDRAVLDGFAHPGQGGELGQLRHEKRQLERDLDRAIKAYRSAQQD